LDGIQRELEEEQGALDWLQRDASTRAKQAFGNINHLRAELACFKTRLEESKLKVEEERNRLEGVIDKVWKERNVRS
jgi:hypothetical protein